MFNLQTLPTLCSCCKTFRVVSSEAMRIHQERNRCVAMFMRGQFDASQPSTSNAELLQADESQTSDMSISIGDEQNFDSDMSVSLANGVSANSTGSVISTANEEENEPFVYDYVGSNLQLSFSDQISIKLNNLNAKHNATRQHKRELVRFLNEVLIGPLIGNNELGIDQMLHCPDTVNRWVRNSDDGFKVVRNLDVCENGCSLFPEDDLNVLTCPVEGCNRPRYVNQAQAVAARQDGIDLNDESSVQFSPIQQLSVVSHYGRKIGVNILIYAAMYLFLNRRKIGRYEPF